MNHFVVDAVRHKGLTSEQLFGLSRLLDSEYFADFGRWDPEQSYGYAPHDVHVVARSVGQAASATGLDVVAPGQEPAH